LHFLFVGEGAEKQKLLDRAQELELRNITFHDPVDRSSVKEFYALADVCLVPLRNVPLFETFVPSKMFEMMAMSRPVIGSVRGEAADILSRAGAIVVEPENVDQLTQAIRSVYELSADARAEMGRRARQFVEANYSRQSLAASYIDVMKDAVAEYRAR
jgi:glycosyltransferase involved in cell wall biosynthesis